MRALRGQRNRLLSRSTERLREPRQDRQISVERQTLQAPDAQRGGPYSRQAANPS